MDKTQVLKRFEKLTGKDRKKALRIINMNMGLASRKHDLALLIGLWGYPAISHLRMNEIHEAVLKGGK